MKFTPLALVLALVMAAFGGILLGGGGALLGLVLGALAGWQLALNERLRKIEIALASAQPAAPATGHPDAPLRDDGAAAAIRAGAALTPAPPLAAAGTGWQEPETPAPQPQHVPVEARRHEAPRTPNAVDRAIAWLKDYATTGNVVAKAGVLVLFVGVSFLLKYGVDRNALPIEVRLAGTAAAALALIVTGWRLRARRASFGLILQGGGIGILYLTIFAAARLYQLLPLGFTFVLLLALVALSAALAVLQDARALATLGTIGGFLAPVLTSTGSGSHVALFSYYALLNLGIVGIAWFKAWRVLNLTGFVFTFVIAAAWGQRYYRPEYFASTEPFLVLSFLFYVAVAALFAHRHPPRLRGYVDGTLVFGLPLVCFALQWPLVRDFEFGRAWTALGMGAVYLLVARWLWRRGLAELRMLNESFLALGVMALSVAIPFAFDGHITAAAWALEGAGLVWIGLRQQRVLARAWGVLLQFGAGFAFWLIASAGAAHTAVLNAQFLGGVFISAGALASACLLYRGQGLLRPRERHLHLLLLGWGLLWWFGNGAHEIGLHVPARLETAALLGFGGASVAALAVAAARLDWKPAQRAALLWLPALAWFVLPDYLAHHAAGPLAGWRAAGWLAALAALYLALRRAEGSCSRALIGAAHAGSLWLVVFVLAWSARWGINELLPGAHAWAFVAWGLAPAIALALLPAWSRRGGWPPGRFAALYPANAAAGLALAALAWVLAANFDAGDPRPLPFLPLLNPLELAQATVLLLVLAWWRQVRGLDDFVLRPAPALLPVALGASAFVWLNAAAARAVHHLGGVEFTAHALHRSPVFQGSISVLWALTALAVMFVATRSARRWLWLCGGALLAALVLKLFFVDLAGSGTVARIVSFLGAGGLMVLIGYLSPAPPRQARETQA